jgi:phage terminase large subunit-like protein
VRAPWLDQYLHELLGFPNSRNDDQIDSTSQFLMWAERRAPQYELGLPIVVYGAQ